MLKTVPLTGDAGVAGSHLADELLARGYRLDQVFQGRSMGKNHV